jgi:hypothetical protein
MRSKGLLVFMGFNPGRNDKYYRKINIDTIEFSLGLIYSS